MIYLDNCLFSITCCCNLHEGKVVVTGFIIVLCPVPGTVPDLYQTFHKYLLNWKKKLRREVCGSCGLGAEAVNGATLMKHSFSLQIGNSENTYLLLHRQTSLTAPLGSISIFAQQKYLRLVAYKENWLAHSFGNLRAWHWYLLGSGERPLGCIVS
jgi:hypothetical protein